MRASPQCLRRRRVARRWNPAAIPCSRASLWSRCHGKPIRESPARFRRPGCPTFAGSISDRQRDGHAIGLVRIHLRSLEVWCRSVAGVAGRCCERHFDPGFVDPRHGRHEYLSMAFTIALFQKSTKRELWLVPGAKHMTVYRTAPAEYESKLLGWFADHTPK